MALRTNPYETAKVLADVYAPALPSSPLPLAYASACVLDGPCTLPELRAMVRYKRCRSALGPDKIPCQAIINISKAAL